MSTDIACPSCRGALQYDPQLAGQVVLCPTCGHQFTMATSAPPKQPLAVPPPVQHDPAPAIDVGQSTSPTEHRHRRPPRPRSANNLLIAGGVTGACALLVLVVVLAMKSGSSDSDEREAISGTVSGPNTSWGFDASNTKHNVEGRSSPDRELAERCLESLRAEAKITDVEWLSDEPHYAFIVQNTSEPREVGVVYALSATEAKERVKEMGGVRGDKRYKIKEMVPIGTKFRLRYKLDNGQRWICNDVITVAPPYALVNGKVVETGKKVATFEKSVRTPIR
ncbi:MAG: hypothetical protein IH991_22795 [Planctomycetes bacterium]|nr:hypothetical protein [Planctomycetota bacterium]